MRFFSVLLLTAAMTAGARAGDSFPVDVVKPQSQNWHFLRVLAVQSGDVVHVSGRMTAFKRHGLPKGHIDIAAYDADGRLLAETTTHYLPTLLTPEARRNGGVRFSARLEQRLPPGSRVSLAFHREKAVDSSPSHSGNIAR